MRHAHPKSPLECNETRLDPDQTQRLAVQDRLRVGIWNEDGIRRESGGPPTWGGYDCSVWGLGPACEDSPGGSRGLRALLEPGKLGDSSLSLGPVMGKDHRPLLFPRGALPRGQRDHLSPLGPAMPRHRGPFFLAAARPRSARSKRPVAYAGVRARRAQRSLALSFGVSLTVSFWAG